MAKIRDASPTIKILLVAIVLILLPGIAYSRWIGTGYEFWGQKTFCRGGPRIFSGNVETEDK
jgi:hypothetical protein